MKPGEKAGILERPKFISADATFTDLRSSGNVHLIRDMQLKNLIFSYYNETEKIRENQRAEEEATITLSGNYFLKRFPLEDSLRFSQNLQVKETINPVEFLNNVLLRVSNRKELLLIYKKADSLGNLLQTKLAKKSNNEY